MEKFARSTNKLARDLPSPDTTCVDETYQDFCNTIIHAANKSIPRGHAVIGKTTDHAGTRSARPSTRPSFRHRRVKALTQLPVPCLPDLIIGERNAGQRQSMPSIFRDVPQGKLLGLAE